MSRMGGGEGLHLELLARFMTDLWEYMKKYSNTDYDNQDYWQGLVDDARAIDEKYEGDKLAQALLLAIVNYHDNMSKGKDI